jgi:hypothetical protein
MIHANGHGLSFCIHFIHAVQRRRKSTKECSVPCFQYQTKASRSGFMFYLFEEPSPGYKLTFLGTYRREPKVLLFITLMIIINSSG